MKTMTGLLGLSMVAVLMVIFLNGYAGAQNETTSRSNLTQTLKESNDLFKMVWGDSLKRCRNLVHAMNPGKTG